MYVIRKSCKGELLVDTVLGHTNNLYGKSDNQKKITEKKYLT